MRQSEVFITNMAPREEEKPVVKPVTTSYDANGKVIKKVIDASNQDEVFAQTVQYNGRSPKYWIRVDTFRLPLQVHNSKDLETNERRAKNAGLRVSTLMERSVKSFNAYLDYLKTQNMGSYEIARKN